MSGNLEVDLKEEDYPLEAAWVASAGFLRRLAGDATRRNQIQGSSAMMSLLEIAARPYIAGLDRTSALELSGTLAEDSIRVSIDYMGEDTHDADEIEAATNEFVQLANESGDLLIDASISLNLSHIGLARDKELALENCSRVLQAASAHGMEVILNMEGAPYRSAILSIFWELGSQYPNLGITLQACIDRTEDDLSRCLELPGRIRLVKGAYEELGEGAIRSEAVNQRLARYSDRLIEAGHSVSIATHDPELLLDVVRSVESASAQSVEFEMLYGVARRRLETLRKHGLPVRVYLPYGTEWLLYWCHRVAEYPPSLHFAIAEMAPRLLELLPEE